MNKLSVLFTCVGRRVELVQTFRDAAKELGVELTICATDVSYGAPAMQFVDKAFIAPRISDDKYIPYLMELCKKEQISAMIPTIDTDLMILAKNKEAFKEIGTIVMVADSEKVALCRDKRLTSTYFNSFGLHSPKTCDSVGDYDGGFPAFIKPKDGSSSINAYKVNTKEDLIAYSQNVKDYIIQPFVSGTEYTVDVFCDLGGRPILITPRIRQAVRGGEVQKTKISHKEDIICEIKKLVADFKPIGGMTVQLIRDESASKNWYIEINPRYGGGAPCSIKAGANSPKIMLEELMGKSHEYMGNVASEGAIFSRFDQSIRVDDVGN